MCCTIGADTISTLSGTQIYAGEAILDKKYVHVLAYQNVAETLDFPTKPNAMVIPFPTSVKMSKDNIVSTSDFPDFLKDISDATKIMRLSRGLNFDELSFGAAAAALPPAEVFESGSYTVVLAEHVAQIPEALKRVSENKRPKIHTQFLIRYGMMYPKQPIAVCCWSGLLEDPEPLLWWYEPTDKENLFIPTMDAHDGFAPKLDEMVHTDHIISVGSTIDQTGEGVVYTGELGIEVGGKSSRDLDVAKQLLPKQVHGHRPTSLMKNGDMFVNITQMKSINTQGVIIKRGLSPTNTYHQAQMLGWHA